MPEALTKDWILADATLTGGARIALADAPNPDRITLADDDYLDTAVGQAGGVVWDPDGVHVWVTNLGLNVVRKVHAVTGAIVASFANNNSDGGTRTIGGPRWIMRRGAFVYFASPTGPYVGEINTATMVCRLYASPLVSNVHAVSCVAGKVWLRASPTGSAQYQEVTLAGSGDTATATATGRLSPAACYDCVTDGTFLYFIDTSTIFRWRESDLSATTLAAIGNSVVQLPGYVASWRALAWDPVAGRLLVNSSADDGQWLRVNESFTAIDARVFGHAEFGGPSITNGTAFYFRQVMAWTDDGSKLAFVTFDQTGLATFFFDVRVVNMGIQAARWVWTPGLAGTLVRIDVPGDLANQSGKIGFMPSLPAYLAAHYEWRRTRVFYQIGAAPRVEWFGRKINAPITAADEIAITVEFQLFSDDIFGPRPWVADDEGKGPSALVTYEIPVEPDEIQRLPYPSGLLDGSLVGPGQLIGEVWEA